MSRSSVAVLVLVAAGLLMAPAAFAAADYLLEIEDTKGKSTARKKDRPIELLSFSWGVSQSRSSASGSGGGAGKASVQDLSVTQPSAAPDAASGLPTGKRQHRAVAAVAAAPPEAEPAALDGFSFVLNAQDHPGSRALLDACASGRPIPRAFLTGGGQRYEIRDLVVASCDVVGGGEQRKIVTRTGHVTLMK
jgi:hypothetical protein